MLEKRVFSTYFIDGRMYDAENFFLWNKGVPFLFFLDTNFAIMIREYISNNNKFMEDYKSLVKQFEWSIPIIKNNMYRIIYQYACEEASRNKETGQIDVNKYELMVGCIEELFNINVDKTCPRVVLQKPLSLLDSKIPLLESNHMMGTKVVISYIMVIKAFILKYFYTDILNKQKIYKFLDFTSDVGIISPMTQTFAIHYLGQDGNILKNIKPKMGYQKILSSLYGAAIDLSLPTEAMQISELTGYKEIPIMVSFDQGLLTIFDSLFFKNTFYNKLPVYTMRIFYSSGWNDNDIVQLSEYGAELQSAPSRKYRTLSNNQLIKIANNLERELEEHFRDI